MDKNSINKLWIFLIVFTLIIPLTSAAYVTSTTKVVNQNQVFDIEILINSLDKPISGAQLDISFNRSMFKVNRISEGKLLNQDGATTYFNSGVINNTKGILKNIFTVIIGNKNVSSSGVFIIVNMTAIGSRGYSWINFSNLKISDPNALPVTVKSTNGSIKINSPPSFTSIPVNGSVFKENDTIQIEASAKDFDNDPLNYIIQIDGDIVSTSPSYKWVTNYRSSGNHVINISVSDGISISSKIISVYVNNVHPPYRINKNEILLT